MWEYLKDIGYWIKEKIKWVWVKKFLLVLLVFFMIYFPARMMFIHTIDDDLNMPTVKVEGGSETVAIVSALIDREVNKHSWVGNDPWFKPGAWIDNMRNYQKGIIAATARFSFELVDQLGRTRGSGKADEGLQEISGLLQYPGDKWVWDPSVSYALTASSEQQYRKALKLLNEYNARLGAGNAVFERRADNLLSTLDRIALDLGRPSATITDMIAEGAGCIFDPQADDLFYDVKGLAYAYGLILKGLKKDFEKVIEDRKLGKIWTEMEQSFIQLNELDPTIVSNCDAGGFFFQNHLASEGFYLLRARTQLREITNILLK
jgi:hypothetical protein